MLKEPGSRRIVAGIGLIIGTVAAFIVLISVLYGETDWWALIVLLPVFAAIRKFSEMIRDTPPPAPPTDPDETTDQSENDRNSPE